MAVYPEHPFYSPDTMSPGARGEQFVANLPGFRNPEDVRVNRTNNHLNCCDHDVPNIVWAMDDRLPVLFKYGFAYGYNALVAPKGRVMAIDPQASVVDFEKKKMQNVITLANGGVVVKLREAGDKYKELADAADLTGIISVDASGKQALNVGKEWAPLAGLDKTYTDKCFRPFAETANQAKVLEEAGYKINATTGLVVDENGNNVSVRLPNVPIGVLERNEYSRYTDSQNGMIPGPIRTDCLCEFPLFAYKDKAEGNSWGSAYGPLFPGAYVRSDENGRITVSALSFPEIVEKMSIAEYEAERSQVLGQVFSVSKDLVPFGSARFAAWALSDRLNFDEYNEPTWRQTMRGNGEDNVQKSPYVSLGEYPGYPFDRAYTAHNLHMLASRMREGNYDLAMDQEYQYSELGIPGLLDGVNAVSRKMPMVKLGEIHKRTNMDLPYVDQIFKAPHVNIEEGTLMVTLGDNAPVNAVEGQALDADEAFVISYVSEKQGIIKIHMNDEKADAALEAAEGKTLEVKVEYKRRGLAGTPVFMDWDGCVGSTRILLQR